MKAYIFTIITVSVIGGIVTSLISDENASLKKRLNFIIGIICAIVLLSPIVSVVSNVNQVKKGINEFVGSINADNSKLNTLIISNGAEKITSGIKKTVVNKFNIDEAEITVDLVLNNEDIESIEIEQIKIELTGKATWLDEFKIKEFVEEQTGCSVKIIKR